MKKTLMVTSVLLTVFIISMIFFFTNTTRPYYQARNETVEIAQKKAGLVEDYDFYMYHGVDESYYTIAGFDEEEKAIAVMVRESDGAIEIFDFDQLVKRNDAIKLAKESVQAEKMLEARMGMLDNKDPVWEVSFKNADGSIGYYYLSLTDGEWIRTINNL